MPKSEDKAWAEFNTPLDKNTLLEFCQDVERLIRINPFLTINKWEKLGEQHFLLHASNQSQIPSFNIETDLNVFSKSDGLEIHYQQGLKSSTAINIDDTAKGSKLTIVEEYNNLPQQDRLNHLQEVDKSLVKWAEDLQTYLISWRRWSWFSPWRYYKQHVWLRMNPSARRITYILLCISLIEFALIALGIAIYIIEYK